MEAKSIYILGLQWNAISFSYHLIQLIIHINGNKAFEKKKSNSLIPLILKENKKKIEQRVAD